MSQNRRTISKIEFNKRVRDLVSRDSNQLRQTFQKFDKEYASRLAEIQSMQEKVRHSMRNLTQERMHMRTNVETGNFHRGARRENETERGKSMPDDHRQGSTSITDNKSQSSVDERVKRNSKASLPGIQFSRSDHLEIPNRGQTRRRRNSLPHPPTFLPGSPKESRALPIHASLARTTISSSLPKETFVKPGSPNETSFLSNLPGSPKETLRGIHLKSPDNTRQRRNDYKLSVNDLPFSSSRSDPVASVRVKLSPQLDRKVRKVTSKVDSIEDDQDINNEHDKGEKSEQGESEEDSKKTRGSHTSLLQQKTDNGSLDSGSETESKRGIDCNNTKPKALLKRTRSSSLPCDPSLLKDLKPRESQYSGVRRPTRSANHAGGGKRVSSPVVPISTHRKENESSLRSFEELRHCRYLRSSDIED